MTFGFRIKTDSGEVCIDENYRAPRFLGKLTLSFVGTRHVPGVSANLVFDEWSFNRPSGSYLFDFWTIPTGQASSTYYNFERTTLSDPRQAGDDSILIYRNSSITGVGGYAIPEGYSFGLPESASLETIGIRIFRPSDGAVAFDSGYHHLQMYKILTGISFPGSANTTSDNLTAISLPISKPAFLVPASGSEIWTRQSPIAQSSDAVYVESAIKRDTNLIRTRNFKAGTEHEDLPINGSIFYGSSPVDKPVIDATNYD